MADGGKMPVTRGSAISSDLLSGSGLATGVDGASGAKSSGSSGEQHGRGATTRSRSGSPTKRTTSSSRNASGRKTVRSPGARRRPTTSNIGGAYANTDSHAANPGGTNPSDLLQTPQAYARAPISNSVPATPQVHARRHSNEQQTPSPILGPVNVEGNISPRSVRSDSDSRIRPSQPSLLPGPCKFETGLTTSRRRIPYHLGGDMLKKATAPVKQRLEKKEEETLTRDMRKLYLEQLLPNPESDDRRRRLKDKLEHIVNEKWPGNNIKVHVFGSSGNLLCTSESDVDICISAPTNTIGRVCNLARCLAGKGMERVVCIPSAKVPIVKIWDPELELACDMNVNNTAAIENTRMIRTYVSIDPRVRPLAMVVKHWTKQRILNDAGLGGTLSSYTWISLLIHFLQSRQPPVLPSLQQRLHQRTVHRDGKLSPFADDIEALSKFGQQNKETLGDLLFGFFRYYAHEFDYESKVISIRAGKLLSKAEKGWKLSVNNRLCVEEPFNTDRNLGNTIDEISFRGVHLELRRAFDLLCDARLDECCQQFEFPPEQERVWYRPPPQPLPILTRSRSQTNRSSRSSEGNGKNNKGRYNKSTNSGRRASSAAASNKNTTLFSPPLHQNQWFPGIVEGGQMSGQMIHEQLSQHMSILQQQEAYFKMQQRQMALAQTHAQPVAQTSQVQQSSPRPSSSIRESSRRSSAIETGPSAVNRGLQGGYLYHLPAVIPRSTASTPAVAHSKRTITNPSSPSLTAGRIVQIDTLQSNQRPMTPDSIDMTRSRSQPPVSSRDGALPPDLSHVGLVYSQGAGGALAGYPGLQHYQQQYLQLRDKQFRQKHTQSAHRRDQNDINRGRNESPRTDCFESDNHELESSSSDSMGYFLYSAPSAQQIMAMQQAQTQLLPKSQLGQRDGRLHPPEYSHSRVQEQESNSRSSSPSVSSLDRERSYSIQSTHSNMSNMKASKQSVSLPTSISRPMISGGPIIIDGSGDSPELETAHRSRPGSLYDSGSEATATDHDRHSDNGDSYQAASVSHYETSNLESTMIRSGKYQNFLHFGELPANTSHVHQGTRDMGPRSHHLYNYPDSLGYLRASSASTDRSSRSGPLSLDGHFDSVVNDTNIPSRTDETGQNGIRGLGIDVEPIALSVGYESEATKDVCYETPSKSRLSDETKQSPGSSVPHQQPHGLVNGNSMKPNVASVLKSAPLLSPVREVRTPSPTTSRTNSVLQKNKGSPVDSLQRTSRYGGRAGQHTRAQSLLSGEVLKLSNDSRSSIGNTLNDTITGHAAESTVEREINQVYDQYSSEHPRADNPLTAVPLSYSYMARKSSQTHEEQPRQPMDRPVPVRNTSGSISPRKRSPSPKDGATLSESMAASAANNPSGFMSSSEKHDRNDHNLPFDTGSAESSLSSQNGNIGISPQQRQLRALRTRELAASVAKITLPNVGSSEQPSTTPGKSGLVPAYGTAELAGSGSNDTPPHRSNLPSQVVGNTLSGWQQATKKRGKKSTQNNSVTTMHKRQVNSIGGAFFQRDTGERKGG